MRDGLVSSASRHRPTHPQQGNGRNHARTDEESKRPPLAHGTTHSTLGISGHRTPLHTTTTLEQRQLRQRMQPAPSLYTLGRLSSTPHTLSTPSSQTCLHQSETRWTTQPRRQSGDETTSDDTPSSPTRSPRDGRTSGDVAVPSVPHPRVTPLYDQVSSRDVLLNLLRRHQQRCGAVAGMARTCLGPTADDTDDAAPAGRGTGVYAELKPRASMPDFLRGDTSTASVTADDAIVEGHVESHKSAALPDVNDEVDAADEGVEYGDDAVGLLPVLLAHKPHGRYVVFNLLTSWGDLHEIGLCGIEMFDERGVRLVPPPSCGVVGCETGHTPPPHTTSRLSSGVVEQEMTLDGGVVTVRHTAAEAGVQMFAQYTAPPDEVRAMGDRAARRQLSRERRRQLRAVVDGVCNTHDEAHMFVMPYSPGEHHLLCFIFARPVTLSMIRIYNYCGKGRVHTSKGVRVMEITMDDDAVLFRGEVGQHGGDLLRPGDAAANATVGVVNCENILFTDEPDVLERIMQETITTSAPECSATSLPPTTNVATPETRPMWTSLTTHHSSSTFAGSTRTDSHAQGSRHATGVTLVLRGAHDVDGQTTPSSTHVPSQRCHSASTSRRPRASPAAAVRPASALCPGDAATVPPCALLPRLPRDTARLDVTSDDEEVVRVEDDATKAPPPATRPVARVTHCPRAVRSICFMLLATWGDTREVGLSGLRLRDAHGELLRVKLAHCAVYYPSTTHTTSPVQVQLGDLLDDGATTACLWPFEPAMLLVLEFDTPIPTLGFLEVANYAVGTRTYCGVKEVRLFLASGSDGTVYRELWAVADAPEARRRLAAAHVCEVTPAQGVSLRKSPAGLSRPRFQTYDLSLDAPARDDDSESDDYDIAVGPGTGGVAHTSGQLGAFVGTTTFAHSLGASMNIRATMAMKRARMTLQERPAWLETYQPYLTPLLPVGYVCKVRLHLCARVAGSEAVQDAAQETLKAYLREWVLHPLQSCSFVNETGRCVRAIDPSAPPPPPTPRHDTTSESCGDELAEDEATVPMVTESVVSTCGGDAGAAAVRRAPLQVMLELIYVADVPFCLSVLCLNRPLVLQNACAAWVRRVQVSMDDALVYDSGEAALDARAVDHASAWCAPEVSVTYRTSLKPYIVFTLDAKTLETVRGAVEGGHAAVFGDAT